MLRYRGAHTLVDGRAGRATPLALPRPRSLHGCDPASALPVADSAPALSSAALSSPALSSGAVSTTVTSRPALSRPVAVPRVLLLVDLLAFLTAMVLAQTVQAKSLVELLLVLLLFYKADLYRPRLTLSVLDDAPTVVGLSLVAGAASMALGSLSDGRAGTARLVTAVIFAGLCLTGRAVAYAGLRALRRQRRLRHRTLILGGGTMARELSQTLLDHPEHGLEPVGLLDDDPLLRPEERPVPLLGRCRDLARVLSEHRIDSVAVAYGSTREPQMVDILRTCDRYSCDIFVVPRLYELHVISRGVEDVWGIPLVRLRRAAFRTVDWSVKRLFDVVVSAALLLLLSPLLAGCALLARRSTGRVLFQQDRVGLDGRPFTLLKFCSLRPSSDNESGTRWSVAHDDRVTPAGRFLRRTSLDELPQLWNVLRGDMSLVGPRPERPYFVDQFTRQFPWYMARHRVPAGLTGWAQVHGLRGDTSIADRARFDNHYIENWSLWGDIKILLRTASQVLRGVGG